MINIIILGSTGSIGRQTLEVIRKHKKKFKVVGLACNSNAKLLNAQAKKFHTKNKVLVSKTPKRLATLIQKTKADLVVNAISGSAGLVPSKLTLKAGKILVLANKESLVLEGKALMNLARKNKTEIFPLDSEHHAVLRLLQTKGLTKYDPRRVKKITLTASGGPFFETPKSDFAKITPRQALKNPNWSMGPKILIESALLLNKGFEVIEAHHLFKCPLNKIHAIIDRKSYVHAIVEFSRTAKAPAQTLALAYKPTMKTVIEDTLVKFHHDTRSPETKLKSRKLKFLEGPALKKHKFHQISHAKFPAFGRTLAAFRKGQIEKFYKTSEKNIQKFLEEKIRFPEIV